MAEHVEGPGIGVSADNLYHFTCEVGESHPRVFRGYFDLDNPDNDVLFTDIETEDAKGGFEKSSELKITPFSSDAYSVKLWDMTGARRAQIRTELIADAGGTPPPEEVREGSESAEETVAESQPVVERVPGRSPVDIPYETTQQEGSPAMLQEMLYTAHDVQAECLNRVYRAAINDLLTYCQLENLDYETRMQLAQQKLISIEELEIEYGLKSAPSADSA